MSMHPAIVRPTLVVSPPAPVPPPHVAVAADGSRAVIAGPDGARQIDPRTKAIAVLCHAPARFAACFRDETWVVLASSELYRFDRTGAPLGEPATLPHAAELAAARCGLPGIAGAGNDGWLAARTPDGIGVTPRHAATFAALPLEHRGAVEQRPDGVWLRLANGSDLSITVPADLVKTAQMISAALVFGGTAIALELRGKVGHYLLVTRLRGGLLWRLRLEDILQVQIAESLDRAIALRAGGELVEIDLRLGRPLRMVTLPRASCAIGVDGNAQQVVVATNDGDIDVVTLDEPRRRTITEELEAATVEPDPEPEPEPPAAPEPEPHPEPEPVAIAEDDDISGEGMRDILVHARLRRLERPEPGAPLDDAERVAYLADWRTLVAAWCRRAAAEAWDRGRISADRGPLPFATELDALLDASSGLAPDRVVAARLAEAVAVERFETWSREGAPHVELAAELELEPIAIAALHVAAAPVLWGELARAYAIIGNDPSRSACDELTIAQLLGLDDVQRAALARALDVSAPLVAHGIVQLGAGRRPFREIVVAPAIVRRLAGEPPPDGEPGLLAHHEGAPPLEDLRLPSAAIELVTALSRPGAAPRILIKGRAGSGRRTLAAALAARAGRTLGLVEIVAHAGESPEHRLIAGLQGAHLRGWIACVSGLDGVEDSALRARLYETITRHPGPVFLRLGEGAATPHDPVALALDLPVPDLAGRIDAWGDALVAAGHSRLDAPALAARFAVGPGTMHRAVAQLAPTDDASRVAGAIRQLRASRIGTVATRVSSLAAWDAVVLPPEITATARDFVARVRQRSTVLDQWGLASIAASARGATALLQGGPGTGKTLLAGAIARDLGYELYRVDLSRVRSKWLGETERNLSAVFDAAEEGECVLLFDEADALFTKRTEVKSSNDRHANVEVDYLLQRLDAFTGVAVLTTNFGTSIDPAFRRRLALNLTLPFPDVEQRVALWRAHLPAGVPVDREIDLDALAGRYPMSGGYIRNAALRAAFRAAERGAVIDNALLVDAIEAEYRDGGRLDAMGVLE